MQPRVTYSPHLCGTHQQPDCESYNLRSGFCLQKQQKPRLIRELRGARSLKIIAWRPRQDSNLRPWRALEQFDLGLYYAGSEKGHAMKRLCIIAVVAFAAPAAAQDAP